MIDWKNFNSCLVIEVTRKDGIYTSSAVAINATTVVTAAHCLDGEVLKVRVSNNFFYNPKGKFLEVESFDLHPEYDQKVSNYECDLAKITLKKPLPKSTVFYPIMKAKPEYDGKFFRLGYGGRDSKNVRTLTNPQLKNFCHLTEVLELDDQHSYSGDSGGPIFIQSKGQLYLVAIHSTLSFGPLGNFTLNPLLSTQKEWLEDAG
jgi:hypothetical protein